MRGLHLGLGLNRPASGGLPTNFANSGDRTRYMGVTASPGLLDYGSASDMIDGDTAATSLQFLNNTTTTGEFILIDFGQDQSILVTGGTFFQSAGASHGVWQISAGDDLSSLTNVGSSFTLGNFQTEQDLAQLSGNTTAGRYLKFTGVSGQVKASGDPIEFQFESTGYVTPTATTQTPAPGTTTTITIGSAIPDGYGFGGEYDGSDAVVIREIDPLTVLTGPYDVWLDASDTGTITKDGSDQVSLWEDKSGNGFDLSQGTAASAPTADVTLNGLDALDFRTSKTMNFDRVPFTNQLLYVWVASWGSDAGNDYLIDAQGNGSNDTRTLLANKMWLGSNVHDDPGSTPGGGEFQNLITIMHGRIAAASGSTTGTLYINGYESDEATTVGEAPTDILVGDRLATGAAFDGILGEIIICQRPASNPLTTTQIDQMTARMERKWRGITPVTTHQVVGLMGQSNMVGVNGPSDFDNDAPNPRISQLGRFDHSAGEIILAQHPLQHQEYAASPGANEIGLAIQGMKDGLSTIGANNGFLLVPCAHGATRITAWQKGNVSGLYDDLLTRMEAALAKDHTALYALWCQQGEGDALDGMSEATYASNMDQFISDIRSDLGVSDLPVVWGQIGTFVTGQANINAAIADLPNRVSDTAYASSASLTDGGDSLHYDAASYRTLGSRMWTAFAAI